MPKMYNPASPRKVCVLGNAGIETKIFVESFPEKNCEMIAKKTYINVGGSGAHIAAALSVLGFKVDFVSQIGRDSDGRKVLSELRKIGVEVSSVLLSDSPTIRFFSIFDKNYDRLFFISPTTWDEKAVLEKLKEIVRKTDMVIICPTTPYISLRAAKLAKQFDKLLIISPQAAFTKMPREWTRRFFGVADFIFLNESELYYYTGHINFEDALRSIAFNNKQIIVITRGERGCTVIHDGEIINQEGRCVEVVDPSGSGDEFLAGFIWSYIQTYNFKIAAKVGCLAGSCACRESELFKKVLLLKKMLLNMR